MGYCPSRIRRLIRPYFRLSFVRPVSRDLDTAVPRLVYQSTSKEIITGFFLGNRCTLSKRQVIGNTLSSLSITNECGGFFRKMGYAF